MTNIISLQEVYNLLAHYRYVIFFPMMVVEGPIVTVIGGFLSSSGIFNLIFLYPLVVLGDLVGDTIYYLVGYWGGHKVAKKWGRFLGVSDKNISKIELHFDNHGGKTLLFGKISQFLGGAVLVASGLAKMPYRKFLYYNTIATLPKSILLLLLGYYFGRAYIKINDYIEFFGLIIIIILTILFFAYRKKIAKYFYADTTSE